MGSGYMKRRDFLKGVGAGAAGLAAAGAPGLAAAQRGGRQPNFVFILADDLGWSDLGCYGNTYHDTPRIDQLASEGMRFTDAYAACPVCSPTRASIISGQYPAHVGVTDFIYGHWRPYAKLRVPKNETQYLPEETTSIAEALGKAGYVTGSFGKWHLGGAAHGPGKHGFDEHVITTGWTHFGNTSIPDEGIGEDEYLTEYLADRGVQFMKDHQHEPFMLYLSHFAVHIPLEARREMIHKYANKPIQEGRVNNPVYGAMVEHVDQSVGKVLDAIDELGLREDTVVVFFSDNGGLRQIYTGEGPIVTTNAPLRGEKGSLFEGGIREPLIVRWPERIEAGSLCDEPVTSVDFYPTFLDLAGARTPRGYDLDGESLAPLLLGKGAFERDAIYWHYPHYHHTTPAGAIRSGDWKLIEYFEDDRVELYRLSEDIGESTDLAPYLPEKSLELRRKLAQWRESVGAKMPKPNPDYDPERAGEWGTHPDAPQAGS